MANIEKNSGTMSIADMISEFTQACQSSKRNKENDIIWKKLELEGAGRGHEVAPTVGSYFKNFGRSYFRRGDPHSRRLLHHFNGNLKSGELLMVIGRPGSGCTSFLKALSHMHAEYKSTTGSINYGGIEADFKAPTAPLETTFCGEEDIHFPSLTVQETLRFAVNSRFKTAMTNAEAHQTVIKIAQLFGIDKVLHTKVGDHTAQGLSGGEKRRVSLAEALLTCPDLICYDNPTVGLDSSTSIEFIQMMREYAHQSGAMAAMSVYQGSDDMVPYFDKALVVNSGHCVYYGPMSTAKAYFESLGFVCPPTMSITDFLNSMSAEPEARNIREDVDQYRVPQTPQDFVRAFQDSDEGKALSSQLDSTTAASKQGDLKKKQQLYSTPVIWQILLCAHRQYRIFLTDYKSWGVEAMCLIVQSLVLGTLFRDLPHETRSLLLVGYVLFFLTLMPSLQSMSEFGNTFAQRPLLLKHKRYRFYHPMSFGYGQIMADAVWKIVVVSYNIPTYFLANLQRTGSNFMTYFLMAYITNLALSMFFRLIAVLSPSVDIAVLPVGVFALSIIIYTGPYIPPPQMQVWLSWFRYLNPMYYAFETMVLNEAASQEYTCSAADVVPRGLDYNNTDYQTCAVQGSSPGNTVVQGADYLRVLYGFEKSHLWRNVGINAGIFVSLAILVGLGMELFKQPAGRMATIFYSKMSPRGSATAENSDIESSSFHSDEKPRRKFLDPGKPVQPSVVGTGHSFAWKDLRLTVNIKGDSKTLLNDLSGSIKPGSMTALMGVSGAGKTTLLNVLSGRCEFGTLSGTLFLDGSPLPKSFRRQMGYVQQQDVHLPTQTVREALRLPAYLRRPTSVSDTEKESYIEEVLEMLEIQDIADALIGVPGAGLNLEQRKRVSMGIEMAAKPDILFLDEPTSGLDGQSAISMTQLLHKLSRSGQTILCTIHQPSAAAMQGFDNVLLLAKGGLVVYDGPYGENGAKVLDYFAQHTERAPPERNPAEYLLETVGAGSRSSNTTDWAQIWLQSTERRTEDQTLHNSATSSSSTPSSDKDSVYATSSFNQFKVVMYRTWLWYWRQPEYAASKLWMNLAVGLVAGMTFLNIPDTQQGAYSRVLTIFISFLIGPPLALSMIPRFIAFRDIYIYREKASQSYSWPIFIICSIIIELPYTLIPSTVFFLVWWFPSGLQTNAYIAGYGILMHWLCSVFVVSLAYLIAAWFPDVRAALRANGFFFMFINTLAGVLSPRNLTAAGWRWYYYVSPLYYWADGMATAVLYDHRIRCNSDELIRFQTPPGQTCSEYAAAFLETATGYLMNETATDTCEYCRFSLGQDYYQQYGFEFMRKYKDIGIFIGFIAFNFTCVFAGTYLMKIHKWKKRAQ